MAGLFDDLIPGAKPGAAGGGMFSDLIPAKPKSRNPFAVANDTVIEAANALAGGVKSVGDFVAPGNAVSQFIDENIIKAGEANQSNLVKGEKARYRADMESAEGIGDEIGSTLGYVVRNPLQSLAQAAGSFALPGAAVKAGGMLGSAAGLGVKGATRAGLTGGAVAGAALSGGDAAGAAYELVKKAGGTDDEATEAARRASVLPAAIGAAGGVIGAERLLAGAGGFKGGALSRALKTAGVEGAQEAVEEGVTQYEGQRAAVPFDPSIDPLKGVAGAATMGAVLGGTTGAGVSLLHGKPAEPKKDAGDILAAPTVDDAISNAMLAIAGPVSKPAWEVVDGLALPGPAQPAAPTTLRSLPAPDGQTVYMADERGNVAPQPAEARTEALNRQFEAGQQADAEARATEELNSTLGITPGLRAAQQQRALRDAEDSLIPVGEAAELPDIPTGEATELEPIPAGEASELVPTPDATELEPIPAGEATELEVQIIEPGDLMAKDGEPFVSKTGAQARAFSTGGRVVPIPDHFGSGKPGYVVRPITEGRPNNTRGTNAADAIRAGGASTADAGRGDGVAGVPDSRPADVLAGAASPTGQGVAGAGAAGNGAVQRDALTPGQRVTLPNKDGVREVWTVDGQTGNTLRLDNGKGRMRAVQVGSPTWDAIQPEGGAATDQATNQNGVSETAGGQPLAGTSKPANESDQDRSNREWRENYQAVVAADDLNSLPPSKITQAVNYAAKMASNLGPKAWAGDAEAKSLITAFQREQELLEFHLKTRRGSSKDAKPAPEPARTQALAPAAAAQAEPAAAAAGPAPLEAGGLKGRKTLQEARTDTALDKEVSENGKRMTRRQWVEGKVAEGLPTRITQEDRIKPMSRMQFFRANNEEQRAHERKIKEAGKKDVFWIGDYEVTKIEHDYATRLAESVAEPAGATSRIAEPNDPNQQSQTATPNTPPLAPTGNADKPGPAKPEAAPGGINAGEPAQAASTGGAAAPESEQVAPKPKVYKTLMAAKLASKQGGNTTRVKKISGGYILREATEKELAAAEKAGRRLAAPKMVDQENDPLLTAIAKLGGLAMTEKADTIGEGNKLTKGGHLFRQGGQGIDTMAEALKELHYIPSHEHERDGGVRWLRDAIKAEYMGSREHFSEAGDKWIEDLQAEAESRYNQDALSDFDLDELDASGYTQISPEAQALTEQLLAEAEALGLDTETLRDDAVRASEGKTDDEYHAELQAIAREAIGKAQQDAEGRDAAAASRSDQDGGKPAGDQGQEGGDEGLKRPPVAEGERTRFTSKDGQVIEGMAVQVLDTSGGNYRIKIRTDEPAPQGGGNISRTVYSQDGTFATLDEPLLTAQTADDLKAKTEREAAGEAAAKTKRDAEQARLRKDAEDRDLKARAEQSVGDFQLGQSADQQMSGMDDLFAQPAPAPAEQAAAILNAAAEPPKGAERLSVLKDVKAGAITPDEVAAAYPAKEAAAPMNTEDAGAELTYNRRNRIKSGIKWDDIASKNDALKVKEVVKQNVYPRPDYQALVDGGMNPLVAHLVKQAYDAIAAKPNTRGAPTDADLQAYIAGVNRVMAGVLAWANDPVSLSKWATLEARSAGAILGKSVNLSELAPGAGKSMLESVYPEGWKGNQAEVIVLGGNKLLGALQPSYDEAKRAGKAVNAGWPASQEAWEKRGIKIIHADKIDVTYYEGKRSRTEQPYVSISYRVGQTRLMDQLIDGAESKDDPKVQAAVAAELEANQGLFIVMDKARRIVGKQETEEAAKDVARELTKRDGKDGGPDDSGIDVAMARREGPPRRLDGENVSSDQLKEAFGFKGVNFGNWMKGDTPALRSERQAHLNHAYDSFADLADLFGVPPKAMSLNGMLGLAIGAQGNGKYAAHFVPGVNEINLTRTSGAGSLAHEWGHALDHYFAEQAGFAKREDPFLTEHTTSVNRKVVVENGRERMVLDTDAQQIRPEIVTRFKAIVQAMNKKPETLEQFNARQQRSKETAKSSVSGWLKSIRRDYVKAGVDEAAIDALSARILALDLGDGKIVVSPTLAVHPVVDELRALYRKKAGRVPPIDQIKGLQSNLDYYAYAMSEKPGAVDHVPQQVSTDYANAAAGLDKDKGGKRYWSTNLEKFARAFDAFVSDELEAKAAKNTYLSHDGRTGETVPMGDERVTINAAIKALVGEIQTRTDDAGNVAMFSRATGIAKDVANAWRILSENDEVFTYAKSDSTDFSEIATGTGAIFAEPEPGTVGADVERAWRIYPASGGQPDKSKRGHVIHYKDGKVELNVDKFTEGSAGSAAYAAVGNYAFNNGLQFAPDRFGMTQAAIERRLENLISLALKFGSTDFIRLLPSQLKAFKMKWRDGDTAFNTEQMLMASYNALAATFPEIKSYTYDLNTGTRKSDVGAVGRDEPGTEGIVARARAAGARAGERTISRAIFTNTFASEPTGKARRDLVGRLGEGNASLLGDNALAKSLYSRAPGARVELEAADAVGREFWRKIDNGESFTDQEVLDALSINRRGSRRFARAMESVAGQAGSGQAAIGWQGDLASFGAYTSRASWDGENFNVFFVPDALAAGADLSDEAQARDRALVSASFKVLPDGRYELSLTDPQPGSTAVDALERAGVAERAGTEAKPYTRVDLSAGDVTSRSIMQEAVRRLALNIGQAPNVMYAARDTGARAGRPGTERNYPADTLRDKFSRAPSGRTATMTVPQVQGIVANIKAAWRNAPNVVVVESLSGPDVPERVREAEKAAAMNGAGVGRGVILGDTVYLAAGAMATDAMVAETLFHEALGHYGLRGMFGKDLDTILGQLAKTLPEKVTAKAIEYGLNPLEQADRLTAAEEVLAEIAQTRPTSTWVQRAIAAIRTWLRTNIPGFADMALNEAEVIRNFIMPARAFVERGRLAAMRDMPAFSRGPAEATADIRFSRTPSASTAPDWITSGSAALQGAAGKIDTYAPTKTIAEKAREMSAGWKQKLVQGMFDAYAPLKALSMDAYIAARMTKAADGAFEGMLMYGKPVMTADGGITGDLDGKGFLGAMRELNGEHDRFFMWLAGNRAERLMSEGKENLFTADEIAAMKALNGGTTPDGRPRTIAFKRALDEFNSYSKSVLDVAEKAGLIDGESRKLWEHDFYVPFYRMSQENEISGPTKIKGLVRQKAFERLKGGKENLGDLMNNTLRNWSHLLSASLANVAASKSLLAAERAGIAIEAKEAQAKEMAKAAGLKGNATYFMDQGLQRWFVVEDPAVLQAISAMEAPALNGLPLQIMAKFKKYLTVGVTIAPAFKVRNLIRDTLAAPAANEMSFNIAKNLAQGWKATDTKTSGYAQMLFSGGLMRFGTYLEGDRAEHVKRLIADGVDDKTILNTPQKVKAMLGKAWDAWQDFGDRMENVNRTALYQQLLDKGMTPREAAFQARDMMDFSLQGSWAAMRTLTAVVPFLNARAQGLYKLGRAAGENPKRMGYMVAAVSLASIALMLAYQDDDDWKAREDWDRDAWWWFKIGETAYRIPKPFEVGAMGTIAERSLELVISDEMTGARFAERMKQMVTGTFAINPVPQMFKPMLDLYANKDSFTGRQIETLGMERLSKPERYGPNTSALAKALGSAGDYTGVSPVQVDHMIRAYFGWLGTMGAATVDAATSPFSEIEKPAKKMDDYFGGFVKELPAASSRYLEDFYEQAKATSEAMADLRRAREAGDTEKAAEIMEERGDKVAQYRVYQQAQQQLAGLNKRIRIVRSSTELDADTKRLRLDELTELRNRIARQVSDRTRAREEALQ